MFEFLIGILAMAAVIFIGFDIFNRIYTREPATEETETDLDKWEAEHADILTSKMMGHGSEDGTRESMKRFGTR